MQLAGKYKASLTVRLIFAEVVGTKGGHLNKSEIELLIFVAQSDSISLSSCMAGNISGIISALRPLQMASNAGSISMQQCHHMLSSVKNTVKLI